MTDFPPPPPLSQVLTQAIDLIENRGWKQGAGWGESPTGPVCLEGALLAAMGVDLFPSRRDDGTKVAGTDIDGALHDEFTKCPAYRLVHQVVLERDGTLAPDTALWHWNDRGLRHPAEVIDVLHVAATRAAQRELSRPLGEPISERIYFLEDE